MRLSQEECAKKLAAWLHENAGSPYYNLDGNLRGFRIDGEVDLMDLAVFVLDTLLEPRVSEIIRSA